ncbi:hypothetical protein UlMin_007611 [Ulmus minor]
MSTNEGKLNQNPEKFFLGAQILLRTLTTAATIIATWMVFTSKQSVEIIGMIFDARYSYSPAVKFYAMANAIVCAFSAISLFFVFFLRRQFYKPANYFFLFLHDLLMVLFLMAGCAAATAIGYVGKYGNEHTGWLPICDHFHKYCKRLTTSMAFSYFAVFLFLILTILSATKSKQIQVYN